MVSIMELLIPSASVLPSLPCSSSPTSPSTSGRSSCRCSALERSSSSPSFTSSFPVRRRLIRLLRPGSSRRKVSRRNYLILTLVSGSTEKMPSSVTTDHDGDVATLPASGKMVFEPILEEGVFRFDCSKDDRHAAFPSFSFADQKVRETPISTHRVPEYVPGFESVDGKQSVKLKFPPGSSMYGTGEVSGQLERTGKRISTWNTDAWGYGSGTTSLYQSHPWVLVLLPDGKAVGILADTTRRCEVDLREACTVKFRASAPYPVITFGPLDSPTSVLVSLSHAIGTVFMPPKWSLGYHQCRFSYESEEKVMQIAKAFRKKRIPCDVIWMDIDYMDGFRCFTFDQESFPDPKSLARELHEIGFKAIWMLDPGIKKESGYFVYDSGCQNDVWVLMDNGRPFVGDVWPGPCVFPDYTQERTRSWWEKLVKDFVSNGVDGIWNDMNEPAVFKVVTKTMPETNIHRGDVELGGRQSHAHYHNVYGMLMARSTYEGMKMAERNKRPFVLTRAGFIGSQRYAATWTGDNLSNWEHLHMSLSMVLQLSLSGQPFSGPDIGGFVGNATPKLYARWMGIGALFPFCRGHSEKGNLDHEPWSFGEECEEVCRLALLRRYRFLPHIYSLFYMAHTKGTPVAVPAFFADPCNRNLRTIENSFLLGPLLICCSTQPDKGSDEVPDVLPRGIWLRFDFDDSHPDLPNLYLQGGSIVPLGPPVHQIRELKSNDDVTLLVSLDEHGKAEGFLYEDDGDGCSFIGGGYLLTYYVAELQSSVVTVKVSKAEGLWIRPKRSLHVCLLLGGGAMIEEQGIDGEDMTILLPSVDEVSRLVIRSEQKIRHMIGNAKQVPEYDNVSSQGVKLAKNPLDLKSDIWHLKVVPWVGGRMISMKHVPTGTQWLHSRLEIGGYEEYSGVEYRSPGCTEEYNVVRVSPDESGQEQSIILEGDISGGLAIQRHISIPKENPKVVQIHSSIVAQSVGAGSGGYSRLVCLRVHPQFTFLHPTEAFVAFVSINGLKHEIRPDPGEVSFEGDLRPNGEWMLVDKCAKLSLVNHFDISEVKKCFIYWGATYVNMELWSEERPVSVTTPINISHQYEVKKIL